MKCSLTILKNVFFSQQPNFSPDRLVCSAKSWQTVKFTKLGFLLRCPPQVILQGVPIIDWFQHYHLYRYLVSAPTTRFCNVQNFSFLYDRYIQKCTINYFFLVFPPTVTKFERRREKVSCYCTAYFPRQCELHSEHLKSFLKFALRKKGSVSLVLIC